MENVETIPTQEYIINNSDLDSGVMTLSSDDGISTQARAIQTTTPEPATPKPTIPEPATPKPTTPEQEYQTVNVVVQSEIAGETFKAFTYTGINNEQILHEDESIITFTSYFHDSTSNTNGVKFVKFTNDKNFGGFKLFTGNSLPNPSYITVYDKDAPGDQFYTRNLDKTCLVNNTFYLRVTQPASEREWVEKTIYIG